MPLHSLVLGIVRRATESVEDIRRQAPGARMVGEFAVRSGIAALRRKVSKF